MIKPEINFIEIVCSPDDWYKWSIYLSNYAPWRVVETVEHIQQIKLDEWLTINLYFKYD